MLKAVDVGLTREREGENVIIETEHVRRIDDEPGRGLLGAHSLENFGPGIF